jgi:hypothetical protein
MSHQQQALMHRPGVSLRGVPGAAYAVAPGGGAGMVMHQAQASHMLQLGGGHHQRQAPAGAVQMFSHSSQHQGSVVGLAIDELKKSAGALSDRELASGPASSAPSYGRPLRGRCCDRWRTCLAQTSSRLTSRTPA